MRTTSSTSPVQRVWRVLPLSPPNVRRPCAGCHTSREFESSGRFRVNAQARRLDVWLIYRCVDCGYRWNRTVHTRVTPEQIGAEALERFHANDPGAALEHAHDLAAIRRAGGRPVPVDGFRIEGAGEGSGDGRPFRLRLELPFPLEVRLERLLAEGLDTSRSRIRRWFRSGVLSVEPANRRALRRPARDGQEVRTSGRLH